MALIVEKYPFVGTTGQCLILDPREKLVYPFNLGNYSEVRMGMYYSFTSGNSNNSILLANDTLSQNSSLNQFFFGLCNYSTGAYLPGQSGGYDYIGVFGYSATQPGGLIVGPADAIYYGGAAGGAPDSFKAGITDITGGVNMLSGYGANGIALNMYSPSVPTGAISYAGMIGMRLITSGSNAINFQYFSSNNTYTSDTSTNSLRTNISNLGSVRSAIGTGFYTTGTLDTSNRLMTPNAILLYCPLFNSRIRIHNLVVERYA